MSTKKDHGLQGMINICYMIYTFMIGFYQPILQPAEGCMYLPLSNPSRPLGRIGIQALDFILVELQGKKTCHTVLHSTLE